MFFWVWNPPLQQIQAEMVTVETSIDVGKYPMNLLRLPLIAQGPIQLYYLGPLKLKYGHKIPTNIRTTEGDSYFGHYRKSYNQSASIRLSVQWSLI